jgi:hypothetical protein
LLALLLLVYAHVLCACTVDVVCTEVCVSVRSHTRACCSLHTHTRARTHARTHLSTHAHKHAHTHAHTHTRARTHAHARAHTHTHTHTHIHSFTFYSLHTFFWRRTAMTEATIGQHANIDEPLGPLVTSHPHLSSRIASRGLASAPIASRALMGPLPGLPEKLACCFAACACCFVRTPPNAARESV